MHSLKDNSTSLAIGSLSVPGSKHTFASLDWLRGVAALCVVFYHTGVRFNVQLMPNAYLAVDLFFCLSGFVIAHSYEHKIQDGLTVSDFLLRRLIRLYPLYALAFVGAVGMTFVREALSLPHYNRIGATASAALSLLFLPSPPSLLSAGAQTFPFPLAVPAWTLSLEMAANLLYVCAQRFFAGRKLRLALVVFAVVLVFSVYFYEQSDAGSTWDTYWGGWARMLWSFFSGVLLFRLYKNRPLFFHPVITLLLATGVIVIFACPYKNPLFGVVNDLIVFPAIVFIAIHTRHRRTPTISPVFGTASYALYITHTITFGYLQTLYAARQKWALILSPIQNVALWTLIALVVALLLDFAYDRPIRKFLARKLLSQQA